MAFEPPVRVRTMALPENKCLRCSLGLDGSLSHGNEEGGSLLYLPTWGLTFSPFAGYYTKSRQLSACSSPQAGWPIQSPPQDTHCVTGRFTQWSWLWISKGSLSPCPPSLLGGFGSGLFYSFSPGVPTPPTDTRDRATPCRNWSGESPQLHGRIGS